VDADVSAAAEYLARIPAFPPRPVPEVVSLPADPQGRWLSRIPTQQAVAFITVDDGWVKIPVARGLLRASGIPVSLFLTGSAIADNPVFFSGLPSNIRIESHSLYHNNFRGRPYRAQLGDICGSADQLAGLYGRRPVLFRPPYGEKDAATLQAAHDCGMRASLHWSETVEEGIVRYQIGNQIRSGDIVLMHFRPAFAEDFLAALYAIHRAGLVPALLDDYLV
jgi:peptidoglycan/xylan/chitin deacetylase (PgdA/CDA1 family)